jgi:hypothetical protein
MPEAQFNVMAENFPGDSGALPSRDSCGHAFQLIDARQSSEIARPWSREPEWQLVMTPAQRPGVGTGACFFPDHCHSANN